jgi:flagellar FliJ protein
VGESRAKRLQIVLTLAERHEQAAAKAVAERRAQLTAEEEQLRQLEEYAEQYLQTYRARTTGLRAEDLITYSGFIQRLNSAQREQQAKLERVAQQYEQALQVWREKYHRRESIAGMIQRLEIEDNQIVEKRLQKELDELTTQQFHQKI